MPNPSVIERERATLVVSDDDAEIIAAIAESSGDSQAMVLHRAIRFLRDALATTERIRRKCDSR